MATEWVLYLGGQDSAYLGSAALEAFQLIEQIEDKLSLYRENSDVCRINRLSIESSIQVDFDTIACLEAAFAASAMLDETFNPFLGAPALQAKDQIDELEHNGGPKENGHAAQKHIVAIDRQNRVAKKLESGPLLDLGGIGKGFALDRIAELLLDWEIDTGLLVSGGSTALALPDTKKETLRLEALDCHLEPGRAIASSGEGVLPNHIIAPLDSQPGARYARSWAVADGAALADAASTAAILMTSEQLQETAKNANIAFAIQAKEGEAIQTFGDFRQKP